MHETAHVFDCAGEALIGIHTAPAGVASDVGMLVIVGGPQYRIGSHRQFALLARAVAAAGHAVLRFDYRGMGDSSGESPGFHAIDADIAAAIDLLIAANPAVRSVVLWGLCDGASAALLHAWRQRDARIVGAVLVNPWLHSEQAKAHAIVHTYYRQHFFERAFWRKLLRGGINPLRSWRELRQNRRLSRLGTAAGGAAYSMLEALSGLDFPMLFLLSVRDPTAQEFLSQLHLAGNAVLGRPHVRRADFADADHTFSRAEWRKAAENATISWLREMFGKA